MQFTRIFALVGVVLAGLAAAAPLYHSNAVAARCSGECPSGAGVLELVLDLQVKVDAKLALLAESKITGINPTEIFVELAALIDASTKALVVAEVEAGVYADVVANIVAKIILDIGTGCSKFQNVKIDGFVYLELCAKIDLALKGLCLALNVLISGCLHLIAIICLAKSVLLSVVLKLCLSLFAGISISL